MITNPNPIDQMFMSKGWGDVGHCGPKAKRDFVVHSLKSIFLKTLWSFSITSSWGYWDDVLEKHFKYFANLKLGGEDPPLNLRELFDLAVRKRIPEDMTRRTVVHPTALLSLLTVWQTQSSNRNLVLTRSCAAAWPQFLQHARPAGPRPVCCSKQWSHFDFYSVEVGNDRWWPVSSKSWEGTEGERFEISAVW